MTEEVRERLNLLAENSKEDSGKNISKISIKKNFKTFFELFRVFDFESF